MLFRLVWGASPALTLASLTLRLFRAVLPVLVLYVGKLIIDEVVAQTPLAARGVVVARTGSERRAASSAGSWRWNSASPCSRDLSARFSSLVDSLLAETYSNFASIRLMEKAASLDLEQFESSDQQDRLDRARRQVTGRTDAARPGLRPDPGHPHGRVLHRSAWWPTGPG